MLIESSGNDPLSHTTVQEFSQDFSQDSSPEKGMTFYYYVLFLLLLLLKQIFCLENLRSMKRNE